MAVVAYAVHVGAGWPLALAFLAALGLGAPTGHLDQAALRRASASACAVRCPSRSMSHWVLQRAMNSAMTWRTSSAAELMQIDRPEEPAPPVLLSIEARPIGAPHHVGPLGRDRAIVRRIAVRRAEAARRQQAVRAHQAQHALAARGVAAVGEPRAYLAIALPMKRARRQDGADLRQQRGVADRGLRPPLAPRLPRRRRSDGKRRDPPFPARRTAGRGCPASARRTR